ncbi:hypothetical protein C7293_04765 [filamentous cyanobacterium CCT1]|nr:hypothetical protein C7293_04765 [filamentous cyanobacterium CCT1]PSN78855.1 hypothetical protein C8B47_14730 [filamentous cyanobacterium CCP4]
MIGRTAAIAIASALTIVSTGLPLSAQVNDGAPAIPPTQPTGDDDVGLPDGVEAPADGGLPDAGSPVTGNPAANGVIILEINGVPTYYAPVDPSQVDLTDGNIPIYRLDREATTSNDTSNDNDVNATEDSDGGFVIYPPADSVEDLEPEDILQ